MQSFLLQPYPFNDNVRGKLLVCGGIGLFITFFLLLFKPFGFDTLPTGTQWLHGLLFGAITFIVSSLMQILLPKIFPSLFEEKDWRSWKEILFLLLTTAFIGAGNFLLMRLLYPSGTTWQGFLQAELITFQVGVFPVIFVVFMKQLTLYRRYAAAALDASDEIPVAMNEAKEMVPEPMISKIILRGENQNEELTVSPSDLLYLSSADNYVKVQYRQGQEMKSAMLRSSLKKMEDQLTSHPQFFRCHRMYLANLDLVEDVSGNAQGLKLHLSGLEEAIPVSRSLTETVRERLQQLSRSPQNA